ncbi:MAG: BamA/TamA family outer membrane protein [Synechococcales bacterium]|nr:BamA/TamA family outer membrane protein [Synechococcales bacterium]
MRFSPALLASFTVSASLGLANSVCAQSLSFLPTSQESGAETIDVVDAAKLTKPTAASGPEASELALQDSGSGPIIPFANGDAPAIIPPESTEPVAQFTPFDLGEGRLETDSALGAIATAIAELEYIAQADSPDGPAAPDDLDEAPLEEDALPDGPADEPDLDPADIEAPEDIPDGETLEEDAEELPDGVDLNGEGDDEAADTEAEEPRVRIADVVVTGAEDRPDLEDLVYRVVDTQPQGVTTRTQLQNDINAIFATGFFTDVRAIPEDTPLGVRVTFAVEPNPVLQNVEVVGSALEQMDVLLTYNEQELPIEAIADQIFAPQYGETLNLYDFQASIEELREVYEANGYVLAQFVDAEFVTPDGIIQDIPDVGPGGVVALEVAEGVIEDIEITFLDEDGQAVDEEGEPIEGRTRDFIITREFETEPGDVFNRDQIQQDLQQVFALGLFDDVRVALQPGEDPRQVDVIVNVIEGRTGSVAAGVGFSSASGVFGSVSYQQENLGGNNQRLGAEVQFGQRELLFDVRFTDPWIATDPYRTSYTVNAFSRRSISLIFDGGDDEVELPNGDRPRVRRLGGAVSFSRPLDEWLGWDDWRASVGLQYQRVSIRDSDGDLAPEDEEGNDLSFTGDGRDDLLTVQLAAVRDRRNDLQNPTSGSLLRVGTEQAIPAQSGIIFNRLRASYSLYLPADLTDFADGPEAFAFNVQGGTVLGDLPPYEAFSLGGTDSVRGYDAGDLGSGRSFLQATAEYRFPIFSIVGGALFFDVGTDLGTASDVPGEPAEIRDKPGTGFGYGLGVRIQSPLGPIRVDYGINDEGDGQIHFGIGERF